jgi:hypothetical protein
MAWSLEGTYFESCSCDAVCPCTWSGFAAKATLDRCYALLAFHIERGDIEGTDVSGLSFAMLVDSPPVMSDGGWKVGLFLDAAGSEEQQGALGSVLGGQLGGTPAMLGPLIGEMLGVESVAISFVEEGGRHRVQIGDGIDIEVADFTAGDNVEAVQLVNVFHPANSTLTVSPTRTARIHAMGIEFGREGQSGFAAPFAWAA